MKHNLKSILGALAISGVASLLFAAAAVTQGERISNIQAAPGTGKVQAFFQPTVDLGDGKGAQDIGNLVPVEWSLTGSQSVTISLSGGGVGTTNRAFLFAAVMAVVIGLFLAATPEHRPAGVLVMLLAPLAAAVPGWQVGEDRMRRHLRFRDFPELLRPGDLMVFNDTRVIKARLSGSKASGGRIEVLVERILDAREALAQVRAAPRGRATSSETRRPVA